MNVSDDVSIDLEDHTIINIETLEVHIYLILS